MTTALNLTILRLLIVLLKSMVIQIQAHARKVEFQDLEILTSSMWVIWVISWALNLPPIPEYLGHIQNENFFLLATIKFSQNFKQNICKIW